MSITGVTSGMIFGTNSGGGTNGVHHRFGWIRVNDGVALGIADAAIVPEPATLAFLLLGVLPMLRRRRR